MGNRTAGHDSRSLGHKVLVGTGWTLVVVGVAALVVHVGWNLVAPGLVAFSPLTYKQALGLVLLGLAASWVLGWPFLRSRPGRTYRAHAGGTEADE